jgi:hypothetical protein
VGVVGYRMFVFRLLRSSGGNRCVCMLMINLFYVMFLQFLTLFNTVNVSFLLVFWCSMFVLIYKVLFLEEIEL